MSRLTQGFLLEGLLVQSAPCRLLRQALAEVGEHSSPWAVRGLLARGLLARARVPRGENPGFGLSVASQEEQFSAGLHLIHAVGRMVTAL